jgi:hypothetical protein
MTFEQLIGTAQRYEDKGMYEVADIYWKKAAELFESNKD